MTPSTNPDAEGESVELRQFREQWKEEVRRRREELHPAPEPPQHKVPSPETYAPSHVSLLRTSPASETTRPLATWAVPGASRSALHPPRPFSGNIARAVEIYRSAVLHEQESDLDEALRLYRQAFRLSPDVDRAFFWEEERLQQLSRLTVVSGHKKATSSSNVERTEGKAGRVTKDAEGRESKEVVRSNGTLSAVLENFPDMLAFEPEGDRVGVPINTIPEELLLRILHDLDTTTLERFATVCRKARVLSLDPSIWRKFVYRAYKPPQISETSAVQAIVDKYGPSNYRQAYIEHPRLRLDGVYIAVCHYVRKGLGENAWVNVSHLITYHRYLRFLPDGQVLSLLANEEHQPALVIPMLKLSLRMKGFYVGDWRLDGSGVSITNLVERHPHAPPAHLPHHNPNTVSPRTRYHFQMALTLRSKPLGRWNRLDLVSYESVNLEDGEVVPLPLKHDRPFWFSKVMSWQGY